VIIERADGIAGVEIKSVPVVSSDAFGALNKWRKYTAERANFQAVYPTVVYGGETRCTRKGVDVMPWSGL
jgi:hypothetical protein